MMARAGSINRDPEKNFEALWRTFHRRYPFFAVRNVDWNRQYEIFRPQVSAKTSDKQLFNIFCRMLEPLNDGHVELKAKLGGGRKKVGDPIDHTVGFEMLVQVGDTVAVGDTLARVYARPGDEADAGRVLREAITLCDEPVEALPLVAERIGSE